MKNQVEYFMVISLRSLSSLFLRLDNWMEKIVKCNRKMWISSFLLVENSSNVLNGFDDDDPR